MLATPLDQLAWIIVKARAFDEEVPPDELESGSNATDDSAMAALEAGRNNPVQAELVAALEDLNEDEIVELLALVWLGRGDYAAGQWRQALADAADTRNAGAVAYLAGTPNLGDLLEQGLAELGYSILGEEGRL
jgi:hypothetical protein